MSFYHRPSGSPPKSLSWANTSCCHQKGHCLNDRWTGCQDERNTDAVRNHLSADWRTHKGCFFAAPLFLRHLCIFPESARWHSRKHGVVEYSRQCVVNVADHIVEVLARLEVQRVAGLVRVDDDLREKKPEAGTSETKALAACGLVIESQTFLSSFLINNTERRRRIGEGRGEESWGDEIISKPTDANFQETKEEKCNCKTYWIL